MLRNVMTAALVLALGLTAAGCSSSTAGTSARDWTNQDRTLDAQNESRGPLRDGRYTADQDGRVRGYDARTNDSAARRNAAAQARQAGEDAVDGVKDAARSIGDAAEDALDDVTDAARDYSSQTNQGRNPNGQGTGLGDSRLDR